MSRAADAHGSRVSTGAAPLADRLAGGLWGLLVGDAVGVPYEFSPPTALPACDRIDMVPPAGFARTYPHVPPGTWSDDGAQALVLLGHLLAHDGLEVEAFGQALRRWLEDGFMAVDGNTFDCGIQTRHALARITRGTPARAAGGRDERDNGNGSVMRVVPLALWFRARHGAGADPAQLVHLAHEQSLPTHAHPRSLAACALACLWVWQLLEGVPAERGWTGAVEQLKRIYAHYPDVRLADELCLIVRWGEEHAPGGSGYVVDTLWAARAALREPSFRQVVQAAVAFGHDTDTTACVAGALAGIVHGAAGIPPDWLSALRGKDMAAPLAAALESTAHGH